MQTIVTVQLIKPWLQTRYWLAEVFNGHSSQRMVQADSDFNKRWIVQSRSGKVIEDAFDMADIELRRAIEFRACGLPPIATTIPMEEE